MDDEERGDRHGDTKTGGLLYDPFTPLLRG